ncbi:RNA-binding protein Raly-like isoform X1 [Schistocerca gregaria]|uniref:RNA-binding protein Raly-like isoform X1 n=1 Tax=Schistocerca gregaria TaxID=7010 RepID=UPI00211EA50C|nr:RNA-binding protein Raly-like isoform X1 [Schistocerca gregaria]XP_049828606.1 RNA-binding protein Raly-like isoform X1 [Schistocerca gregaria]
MKMSKVGNQTNSQDPQAVNSRVFVGNLNTFQCSKTDVERMFQRYGRIAGISMHKGYAFVQFTNPFDARSACLGEDARTVLGQVLDVNLVAEPKPHQTGRKRQNVTKTGNDWDYYYDSYYASAAFAAPRLVPPLKRPRLVAPPPRPTAAAAAAKMAAAAAAAAAAASAAHNSCTASQDIKTYSNPDILICGNCREMFTDLHELLEHKKTYCKLRFTCKCHNGLKMKDDTALLCFQCKDSFHDAWDLMVHVQAAHMLNIYQLGVARANGSFKSDDAEESNGDSVPAGGPLSPVRTEEVVSDGVDSCDACSPASATNGEAGHVQECPAGVLAAGAADSP